MIIEYAIFPRPFYFPTLNGAAKVFQRPANSRVHSPSPANGRSPGEVRRISGSPQRQRNRAKYQRSVRNEDDPAPAQQLRKDPGTGQTDPAIDSKRH